jgi:hypothetical protein
MAFETLIILNNDLSLVGEHMKHIRAGERRKGSGKGKNEIAKIHVQLGKKFICKYFH